MTNSTVVIVHRRIVARSAVNHAAERELAFHRFVLDCLRRHTSGDWGDIDIHDVPLNDGAVVTGARVLSSYTIPAGTGDHPDSRLWIISDAVAEPATPRLTTVLFPHEY